MMEVVVITGAISRAKLQSNHHHQQTNRKHISVLHFIVQSKSPVLLHIH